MALAMTSYIMLQRSDDRKDPCLVPDLREKASGMFSVGFCRCSSAWRSSPIFLVWWIFTSTKCWILSNAVSSVSIWSYDFPYLVCWYGELHWLILQMLNQPCIHGINNHLVKVYNSFHTLPNLTCLYFMEVFGVYVHERHRSVIFVFNLVLALE